MNRQLKHSATLPLMALLISCASQQSTLSSQQPATAGYEDLDETSKSVHYCSITYKNIAGAARALNDSKLETQMTESQALATTLFFANVYKTTGGKLTARQERELRILSSDLANDFKDNMDHYFSNLAVCNILVDELLETDLVDARPYGLEFYEAVNIAYKNILEKANSY